MQYQRPGEDRPGDLRQMGFKPARQINVGDRSLGLGLSLGLSFSLKLLKRDRGAGFVHRGLGLGDVQCVLSGAERVEHGLGNDSGYPLTVDGEMSDDAMAG